MKRNLGRMVETGKTVETGEMGISADSDIWDICWNCFSAPPEYASPHITYSTVAAQRSVRVFTVGQSFTTILMDAIYNQSEQPVWDETDFSWYNTRVMHYPSELAWGTQISEQTDDYAYYLDADVIIIEFLQNGDGAIQFQFADHLLQYLEADEVAP